MTPGLVTFTVVIALYTVVFATTWSRRRARTPVLVDDFGAVIREHRYGDTAWVLIARVLYLAVVATSLAAVHHAEQIGHLIERLFPGATTDETALFTLAVSDLVGRYLMVGLLVLSAMEVALTALHARPLLRRSLLIVGAAVCALMTVLAGVYAYAIWSA